MAEPSHKRARIGPPEGFTKAKPKTPVTRAPAAFQSEFVQPALITSNNPPPGIKAAAPTNGNTHPAPRPPTVKAKDTSIKAPQPLRPPEFQKATPQTPPANFSSRARALKVAEASVPGSPIMKPTFTSKTNVRSPMDPVLRRAPKAQTPHLHLDSPLTPLGETPRATTPAETQRKPAPPAPSRPTSPTPYPALVPPRPPQTPARKLMSLKTPSAVNLPASLRTNMTPARVAPLPGPPPLPVGTPPPPMQPLNAIHQMRSASPEKKQANTVSISATRIARATDLSTAGGSAELLGVMLGASGRELRSAGEKELARGLEITPTKPKSRRSGLAKGKEREKLGERARAMYDSRRLKRTLKQHVEQLGPPKSVWKVLEVIHPLPAQAGILSGEREHEGNAVLLRCVKEGAKTEGAEETKVLLAACTARVIGGSLVRVWAPVVVVESERGKVLLCARHTIDEVVVK